MTRQKILRILALLTLPSLLFVAGAGCNLPFPNPQGTPITVPQGAEVCIAQIVFALWERHEEGSTNSHDIVEACAHPALDLAAQFSGSRDLQALVQLLPNDPTFPYTFDSAPIDNCASGFSQTGTFYYDEPLVLIVGSAPAGGAFSGTTFLEPLPYIRPNPSAYELLPAPGNSFNNATTDAELIAQAVYTQENLPQYFNKPGQASDSFSLAIPAHSKVVLHLPLIITYRIGEGEVNHGGQPGLGMLWAYTPYFERNFDPANLTPQQEVVTSC
jgi:hypothetical protein